MELELMWPELKL